MHRYRDWKIRVCDSIPLSKSLLLLEVKLESADFCDQLQLFLEGKVIKLKIRELWITYGAVECGWRRCWRSWRVYLEHINPLRWAASIIPPSIWNSAKASSTLKKHRITFSNLKMQNYYSHIIMVVNELLQENMK